MDTLKNLVKYIINMDPGRDFNYYIVLFVLAALLIGASIYFFVTIKQNKDDKMFRKLFKKYIVKLPILAACFLLYTGARYTQIPVLSARLVLYILLAILAIYIYKIVNSYLNVYPQMKKRHDEQVSGNKYLSKKKK